ncbi:MAG TPA: divergent polysaccharide deacetylase family protein [Caulobacteraceae bacterium]
MFARRQSTLAATAGAPPVGRAPADLRGLFARLKKPQAAALAAGALCLLSAVALVTLAGDPRAGAPEARAALKRAPAVRTPAPTGAEVFSMDTAGLYQDLTGADAATTLGPDGQAVITLPDGGSAAGGDPGAATPYPVRRRFTASPLAAAPLAGLHQQGPNGPLPVIAPGGRTAFAAYRRPFTPDGRPRVALVVGGLGLNAAATRAAIDGLPPEVTLSFIPYAEGLQNWIDMARAAGHEVLLEIPMEPVGYPEGDDTGDYTLLAQGSAAENQRRLDWLLGRATGYAGLTNYKGQRFVTSDGAMTAFLGAARQRGLAFIDDGLARRRPGAYARASAERVLDEVRTPEAIVAQLNALEASAKAHGQALGSGFGYPVTVEAAARWAAGLQARGVQLAPASALARPSGR